MAEKIKARAWMRELEIILTSTKYQKKMVFGTNWKKGKPDLNISVTGTKYLSSLKDRMTVTITNLTYREITELISGQFYNIEIKAGYRKDYQTSGAHTIFKGGVLYISNVLGDRKSNDVVILCASEMVARYGQNRLNLSLNSGINMYSAISFILARAGISSNKAYIDEDFKSRILKENEIANGKVGSWLDTLCNTNNFVVNTDGILGSDVAIWSPYRRDIRKIKLTNSTIILTGGYPSLDSDGLKLSLMPTFGFAPGDTIEVDNSIIDIGTRDESEALKNIAQFMDRDGNYIVYQIDVNLENRGSNFSYNLECKAKSLWSNILGGLNNVK